MNNNIFALGDDLKRGTFKRTAALAIAGSILFSAGAMEARAYSLDKPEYSYSDFLGYNGTKIFINGRFVEFSKETGYPMIINGVTYVPVNVMENVFNAYVYYSSSSNRIYISKHGAQIRINLNNGELVYKPDLNKPLKGKITTSIKSMPFISNNVTYIPLKEVFGYFGAQVIWDAKTNSISVVSDYEKNSQNLDLKGERVLELKDVDLSKNYSKIFYDGQLVEKDYLKLLLYCKQYKVIEQEGVLYIFSYQYLFDVNYIYGAHRGRKNNLDDNDTAYKLWSLSENEIAYARELSFIDGYRSSAYYKGVDMDESGFVFSLMSLGSTSEYSEINNIVDKIVSRVREKSGNPKEMIQLVNDELCSLISVHEIQDGEMFDTPSVYTAIVNKDGVCSGYSKAFKYIMDKLGIPCISSSGVIRGTAIPHAWNEVFVDGEWKIVDVYSNDNTRSNRFLLLDMNDSNWNRLVLVREEDKLETDMAKLTLKLNNLGDEIK